MVFGETHVPSGNLLHSYWKWPLIVDLPIENGDCNPIEWRACSLRRKMAPRVCGGHHGGSTVAHILLLVLVAFPFGAYLSCTPMLVRSTLINSIAFFRKTATRISRTEQCLTENAGNNHLWQTLLYGMHISPALDLNCFLVECFTFLHNLDWIMNVYFIL